MVKLKRFIANPILAPSKNKWEKDAVFNGCPIEDNGSIHLFYRALEQNVQVDNKIVDMSTIGYAKSLDVKTQELQKLVTNFLFFIRLFQASLQILILSKSQ